MQRPIGVRVFPSRLSEKIRASTTLYHYERPADPPIDYNTVREKPKIRADYRVVVSSTNRREESPDYTHEEDALKSNTPLSWNGGTRIITSSHSPSLRTPTGSQGKAGSARSSSPPTPTQNIHRIVENARASPSPRHHLDTISGAAQVLEDLDNALEEDEQMSFEEIRKKVQAMNLSFRQYAPMPNSQMYEPPDDYEERSAVAAHATPVPRGEKNERYASNVAAPVLDRAIIADLKRMPDGIADVKAVNDERRKLVEERLRLTEREIERIHAEFTPEYFVSQTPRFFKGTTTEIPHWKRLLMAKRIATEALRQQEQAIWEEFESWKRQFEPTFPPRSEHSSIISR